MGRGMVMVMVMVIVPVMVMVMVMVRVLGAAVLPCVSYHDLYCIANIAQLSLHHDLPSA